ncbi:MAG: hypothetical protein Q7T50_07725 [Candidatus Magasanikbacteria bacterium]|nr:hypothetical protein [Candidatus Magasanikbacteria bacterium]
MNKTYYNLFYEIFRSFTIPGLAISGAIINFYCKNIFVPIQVVPETAKEKFEKSLFADPAQTKKTMDANRDLAKKIAEFANADCSQSTTGLTQKSKISNLLPRFS